MHECFWKENLKRRCALVGLFVRVELTSNAMGFEDTIRDDTDLLLLAQNRVQLRAVLCMVMIV
jgi:hypothetical protein